ncbi:MAG TPA: DUF6544 family protein, partial [Kofleriaceae bacterium]|nr:DUF6544 family protein [Kofleriaceae bacterium]
VLLVCPIIVAIAGILPNSSSSQFRRLADDGFSRFRPPALVTDADLETLPAPVERYLRYVGVVGKPRIVNLKAQFRGSISATRDAPARAFTAEQVSFFDTSMRLFFIESSRSGLPFDALHAFVGPDATMRVKIASLVPVVDARGSEMNESETVTMFNDMCVLAPATLIDPAIRWETVSDSSVKATFTRNGVTIRAVLTFGANGELVNFTSSDRFQTSDGKTYHRFAWSTPVKNYRDYRGYRLASYGDATWHEPTGDFTYGHFELEDIRYNATTR